MAASLPVASTKRHTASILGPIDPAGKDQASEAPGPAGPVARLRPQPAAPGTDRIDAVLRRLSAWEAEAEHQEQSPPSSHDPGGIVGQIAI